MSSNLIGKSIALIIPDFDFGGEEKRAVFFANNYSRYFEKVYIIAPSGKSVDLLNKNVEHVIINTRNYKNGFKIIKFLKDKKVDFLQGHKRATLPYLYFAEKLLNVKCVFNFDNIYLQHNKRYSFISPNHILYLSDILKDFYSSYYIGHNNLTINMGGDFYKAYSQDEIMKKRSELQLDGKFVILSMGRLSDQKNQKMLLSSLPKIKDDIEFICLMAGTGSLQDDLERLVKESGIEGKVRFLGHRTDVEYLLNISDVVIQSSIFEGFPNVLIEAVSVGVPIIATDVGSSKTLVKSNGILIESEDEEQLVTAINNLYLNYDGFKAEAIVLKDSEFFKQFHKSNMLKGYLEFYENL